MEMCALHFYMEKKKTAKCYCTLIPQASLIDNNADLCEIFIIIKLLNINYHCKLAIRMAAVLLRQIKSGLNVMTYS